MQSSFEQCKDIFGRQNLLIFSNSAGSPDDKDYHEAHQIEKGLGIPVLKHKHKVQKGPSVVFHFRIRCQINLMTWMDGWMDGWMWEQKPLGMDSVLEHFGGGVKAQELAMVGDRYFTDILFGNLHGMLTIHTGLLTSHGDVPIVKLVPQSISNQHPRVKRAMSSG